MSIETKIIGKKREKKMMNESIGSAEEIQKFVRRTDDLMDP